MRNYRLDLITLGVVAGAISIASQVSAQEIPPAQSTTAEAKRLVDQPDERVSVLNNGLTVIFKTHRTAPVVSVRMYCKTGSIYEQEYLGCGMSHLFEHLLHGSATTTRSEEETRRILDEIGGNANAYTSFDVTAYYINTGREHLATAVHLIGDWLTRPTWPQEAFDREWGVVQRELERDVDNPDRQLFYLMMETMYRVHPARYPTIGYQPVVQTLTKEDIVAYHGRMYVPDNMIVVVVGDIDLDQTLQVVQKEFAEFKRRPMPNITLPIEPEMTTPRFATKRMKVEAAIIRLAWPSILLTHPDLYALDVLSYVLSAGESARLVRTIRDQGLTYTIDSFSWTPSWGKGIFAITARLAPDKIEQVKTAISEQIERLQTELISAEELDQAKRQKAAEQVFASQTAENIAEMLARDYRTTGDVAFSRAYVDNIQKVTAEQVREMARKYLQPHRLATITILPEDFQPPTSETAVSAEPEPVRKITLANGLRCLIRRDPTTPLVAIQAFSLGGTLAEDDKTNGLSRLVALLARRGTQMRSAEQIARFFDTRGGTFGGTSGSNTIYFAAQVLKEDFADALEVVADVVCHPTFPADELENYRPRLLDQIKRINEMWRSELMAYLQNRMFKHSPYRLQPEGSADVVAKVTREDVAAFYKKRITGANTVVAIFGDVDTVQAESLAQQYFGSMPAGEPFVPSAKAEPTLAQPELYIKQKPPTRNVAGVGLGFAGMKIADTDGVARMTVLDTIISGYHYPTGWLHESLRGGNRSLVYEVHAMNRPGLLPGAFQIYAACQPDKVAEVYRIITEQLDRARAGEFTEKELETAKDIITTTDLMSRQTNSDVAMQAALDELYGLGYDYRNRFAERIGKVTLDDVKKIADRYLTTPIVSVVTPAPEKVKLGIEPNVVVSDEQDQK